MMKKLAIVLSALIFLTYTASAYAQIGLPRNQQGNRGFTIQSNSSGNLSTLISNTIGIFFAIGGIGFMIMIFWGATNWILSGGDKEKVAGARKRITTAIIGIVLLSLSYVIIYVIGYVLNIEFLQSGTIRIPRLLVP